jgi:geranylgeranyl diphosphate synthase type II
VKISVPKIEPVVVKAYEKRFLPLLRQIGLNLDRMSSQWLAAGPGHEKLVESVRYSLLADGKRFRPVLSCLIAQALKGSVLDVMGWACAVEFVHCYSLIHDDLPSMDNDDLRRGRPSNHKVYGEGMALLAGDGLLTEAFGRIAESYRENPAVAMALVSLLAEAAGLRGMVAGQALDIWPEKLHGLGFVQGLHEMKTGALIRAAAEGAAVVSEASGSERERVRRLGAILGFAFQLADDLLDFDSQDPEPTNFVNVLGAGAAKEMLNDVTQEAKGLAREFFEPEDLLFLIDFNLSRKA